MYVDSWIMGRSWVDGVFIEVFHVFCSENCRMRIVTCGTISVSPLPSPPFLLPPNVDLFG